MLNCVVLCTMWVRTRQICILKLISEFLSSFPSEDSLFVKEWKIILWGNCFRVAALYCTIHCLPQESSLVYVLGRQQWVVGRRDLSSAIGGNWGLNMGPCLCGDLSFRVLWRKENPGKRGTRSDMIIVICLARKFSIKLQLNPKVRSGRSRKQLLILLTVSMFLCFSVADHDISQASIRSGNLVHWFIILLTHVLSPVFLH